MFPLEQCFDLTGERAIVTGAASGIGASIARALFGPRGDNYRG